jgi:hypothetical protein
VRYTAAAAIAIAHCSLPKASCAARLVPVMCDYHTLHGMSLACQASVKSPDAGSQRGTQPGCLPADCTFRGQKVFGVSVEGRSGLITLERCAVSNAQRAGLGMMFSSRARVTNTTFSSNANDIAIGCIDRISCPEVFTDADVTQLSVDPPMLAVRVTALRYAGPDFLSSDDAAFVALQQARPRLHAPCMGCLRGLRDQRDG